MNTTITPRHGFGQPPPGWSPQNRLTTMTNSILAEYDRRTGGAVTPDVLARTAEAWRRGAIRREIRELCWERKIGPEHRAELENIALMGPGPLEQVRAMLRRVPKAG